MKKPIRLSPELEKTLLAGVIHGAVPLEAVDVSELSATGLNLFRAAKDLILGGATPPLPIADMAVLLTNVYGLPEEQARARLEAVKSAIPAHRGAAEAVRKLRERNVLLTVANAAAKQLQTGEYNPDALFDAVSTATVTSNQPMSLADLIGDRLPDPPLRVPLRLLPNFSHRIGGGLVGLTVVSGEPAVGKSDLALQSSLEAQRHMPVVYYDIDNGLPTVLEKIKRMLGDDIGRIKDKTKNLYFRESIRTLDADLVHIKPPALVVVDIFQALPTPSEFERQGLAQWIRRLSALRSRGYVVLVVSEVNRNGYGNPSMGALKGSGEIEYAADLAFQLVPTTEGASVKVIKNRHGAFKGDCVSLVRKEGLLWGEYTEEWHSESH